MSIHAVSSCRPEGFGDNIPDTPSYGNTLRAMEWEPSQNRIDTLFRIHENSLGTPALRADCLCAAASLQGLLNSRPAGNSIYIARNGEYDWSEKLGARCIVDFGQDYRQFFRRAISSCGLTGYTLMASAGGNEGVRDAAIATNYACVNRSAILTRTLLEEEHELFGSLMMVADATGKDSEDVLSFIRENRMVFSSNGLVSCVSDSTGEGIDIAIAHGWMASWDSVSERELSYLTEPCSPVFTSGSGTEEEISSSSSRALFRLPSACSNLSTLERGPVFHNDLAVGARKFPLDRERKSHLVSIVISGGEDLAAADEAGLMGLYSNQSYGSVPITVSISSSMKAFRPVEHNWFQRHTHSSCSICSGIGGPGEVFLSEMGDEMKVSYGRLTDSIMKNEGQNILALSDHNLKTWDKVVAACTPMLREMENCGGAVYFNTGSYDGMEAKYAFVNGIPLIGARYKIGHDGISVLSSISECANMIIRCSVDPVDTDSYSVILLPAGSYFKGGSAEGIEALWQDIMTLVGCLSELDDVEIVSLGELFGRFTECVDGAGRIN